MIDKPVHLIGVPMDLGGFLRGTDMGPSAVRIAHLERRVKELGIEFHDRGNVNVPWPAAPSRYALFSAKEEKTPGVPLAHFVSEIAECCRDLRGQVEEVLRDGGFPFVVGGDHSIAAGTVGGISSHHHARGERIGLIWFDAHADMNTPESSPSGNVHGMPLATCLGFGAPEMLALGDRHPMVDVSNAVLIGIRDLDDRERTIVHESGIRAYSMREVDILGIHRVMREALEIVNDGTAGFHLSFDLDGCDPAAAPGVGTPVKAGMTLRESHLVMEHAAESGRLLGLELTEINPIVDQGNRTAELAVELALSALGKRIL